MNRDHRIDYQPPEPPLITVDKWRDFSGPLKWLPRQRSEVYEIFGNPGVGKVDKKWRKKNIVECRDMPGVPHKWYFQCHRLAEPYIREAFRRADLVCPCYQIERAASFVFRHMRHDSVRPLSYHSWGIAVDIDPKTNRSQYFKYGEAPEQWSPEWEKIWPDGLPKLFVDAFLSVGFIWGADWDGDGSSTDHRYIDPMHFELMNRTIIGRTNP
jgi:hypothetical protein